LCSRRIVCVNAAHAEGASKGGEFAGLDLADPGDDDKGI